MIPASSPSTAAAETIALKALAFLANAPGAMERFMAQSGADAAIVREQAENPEFLAAVVDFLLSDDALATEFCRGETLDPRVLHTIRHALPGG